MDYQALSVVVVVVVVCVTSVCILNKRDYVSMSLLVHRWHWCVLYVLIYIY
jgi:hypothetical protein